MAYENITFTDYVNGKIVKTEWFYAGVLAVFADKRSHLKLEIIRRYSKVLGSEKWSDHNDETILTFGQVFNGIEEIEKFQKTKLFKSILKACQK